MSHQLPLQFIESLKGLPGFDEQAFIETHSKRDAVTSVRINPNKQALVQLFADAQQVPWCSSGRYLPERPSFTLDPVFHGGAYYVQEASSMFIDHVLKHLFVDEQPKKVLDLCGAPGGKSTLLAGALPNSFMVSNEVIKTRVTILAENISKWGSTNAVVTNNDPKDFSRLAGMFDLMVVDAPCSGSGLFRKDPGAIEEWSESSVEMCSLRQRRILDDAIGALATNGILIYSTCSYSKEEDEDVCDWIIDEHHLTPVPIPIDPSWGIVETHSSKHNVPGYRFYPDKLKGEGFFLACFKQEELVDQMYYQSQITEISKAEKQMVERWVDDVSKYFYTKQKETIIAFPNAWKEEWRSVAGNLQLRKSGVAIGEIKGKDIVPHHELALSNMLHPAVPYVDMSEEEALKYLKRQDLQLDTKLKGWALARHKGINLGWMKLLPNRVNNYYPTNWRILKP